MVRASQSMIDRDRVADICERNDIAYLGLFGSVARGEATVTSDIDLLVRFRSPKSLLDIVRIERELSDRLGRPVDLVTEGALSPYLKEHVIAEAREIYEISR